MNDPLLTINWVAALRLGRITKTIDLLAELEPHLDLEEVLALAGMGVRPGPCGPTAGRQGLYLHLAEVSTASWAMANGPNA